MEDPSTTPASPLWAPDAARIAASALVRFADWARARYGAPQATGDASRDYAALWRWSVECREAFWSAFLEHAQLLADPGTGPVLRNRDAMPGAVWFEDTRLNYAENLLHGAGADDLDLAILAADETGARQTVSWGSLRERVARVAAVLEAEGVGPGDVVAGFLPNTPDAVIAMLATASLGAVWTSTSPDFGADGVIERFSQVRPRVLFAVTGYRYAGRDIDVTPVLQRLRDALPSLGRVLLVGEPLEALERAQADRPHNGFRRMAFNAPLCILYSSGTTGKPKCIVHGIGGSLVQHVKEHRLHVDLRRGDRLFYFTTCGWMMWNWLVSGLASGAAIVLYDGSPTHPARDALWDLADELGITQFGTSPRYLALCEKTGSRPAETHALPALRTVLSTGAPLAPAQFDYVYRDVKRDLHLASISGGTDILSCFCLGVPTLPVHAGELQAAGLGMAVDVREGDLVCTAPFPSMPLGFAEDPDGLRYRAAYYERFPGVWHHGDYATRTAQGGFIILGRSDATLNPGGVRIGTAEIYRQVEKIDEVLESIAIGQRRGSDERIVLFVRLRPGVELDTPLARRIRDVIRQNASPRHVPARILQVQDIPRTLSGKLVELAVRDVVHGRPVGNLEAIANPQSLAAFRDLPELRD
jgi:acetoacetyl-CoA synthetase